MTSRTHEVIAMGPTGNLLGSVKFYCLTTGRILKRRESTPYPMPDWVIKRVNQIGAKEKQGRMFRFVDRRAEPYEWTDEVPEDDSELQGLLEEEEDMAPYPDISAEPPGVELESEESDFQLITDDPEPNFRELAAAALDNAGINPTKRIHAARDRVAAAAVAAETAGPRLVEADEDKIAYEITYDLPDAGLGHNTIPPNAPAFPMTSFSSGMSDDNTTTSGRRHPPRSCRSVIRHQQPLHNLANETVELLTNAATNEPTPPRIPIAHPPGLELRKRHSYSWERCECAGVC
jgi:hypothetical protein